MEDNFICSAFVKPLLMWHVRCDNSFNVFTDDWLLKFTSHYKIKKYILALEKGTTTGKPHLQGAIWFDHDIKASNKYANIRSFLRHTAVTGKNRYSLTPARKPRSLAKYAMKVLITTAGGDGSPHLLVRTNLKHKELDSVGSWVAVSDSSNGDKIISLKKQLKEILPNYNIADGAARYLEKFYFLYKKIFNKIPKNRALVFSIAYECGFTDLRTYYQMLGVIDRDGCFGGHYVHPSKISGVDSNENEKKPVPNAACCADNHPIGCCIHFPPSDSSDGENIKIYDFD